MPPHRPRNTKRRRATANGWPTSKPVLRSSGQRKRPPPTPSPAECVRFGRPLVPVVHHASREGHPHPAHWKALADTLMWDFIRPHAPEEYEMHPGDDPEWDWKAHPDVRDAIRPTIAQEAETAAFLVEESVPLTHDATNLFIDAVSDSLLAAYQRLEGIARGNYAPDAQLASFPHYEKMPRTDPHLGVWQLFESWAQAVKPATATFDRWSAVFKAANARFPDAVNIEFAAAKSWMNGLINDDRSAHTVTTVWRTALKTVFGWGMTERLIKNNPIPEIRIAVPRRNTERETKAFSPAEARIILFAALARDDTKSYDERTQRWVPWICAYSGARAGEITQLRGLDVQQRGNDFFVRLTPSAGTMKTRKARTVPLHEHLIAQDFLSFVARAEGGALFYDPGRPVLHRQREEETTAVTCSAHA